HVRQLYRSRFDDSIAFFHAHRTRRAKRTVMRKFRQGKIRILIATEAPGMVRFLLLFFQPGADIPDIELVIQFGFPKSLSVWIQRAGRAGRSPELQARAILLVEESAFQRRKKHRRKRNKATPVVVSDSERSSNSSSDSDSEAGSNDAPMVLDDGKEWGKNVEGALREYASTGGCRRNVTDDPLQHPAHILSVLPSRGERDSCKIHQPLLCKFRPIEAFFSSSEGSFYCPLAGQGVRLERVPKEVCVRDLIAAHLLAALDRFRIKTVLSDRYCQTSFTAKVILPDATLTTLASKGRIKTLEDIASTVTNPPWMMAPRHGQEVLDLMARLDRADQAKC
ncbi:P-loop containing nucleoside triphosphate hydrolase protein, partial [Mycena rosella]